MNLDLLSNLGWREALMALVVLLVLYVFVVFLRIRRLKRKLSSPQAPDTMAARSAVAAYAAVQNPDSAVSSEPSVPLSGHEQGPIPLAEPSNSAFPWNEPPGDLPEQRRLAALEREIGQLRSEVGSLRTEVYVLKEELKESLAREQTQAQVAQNVSPLYSDAMQMAIQGHDAVTISQHCGISRAEAELVVALVRNQGLD